MTILQRCPTGYGTKLDPIHFGRRGAWHGVLGALLEPTCQRGRSATTGITLSELQDGIRTASATTGQPTYQGGYVDMTTRFAAASLEHSLDFSSLAHPRADAAPLIAGGVLPCATGHAVYGELGGAEDHTSKRRGVATNGEPGSALPAHRHAPLPMRQPDRRTLVPDRLDIGPSATTLRSRRLLTLVGAAGPSWQVLSLYDGGAYLVQPCCSASQPLSGKAESLWVASHTLTMGRGWKTCGWARRATPVPLRSNSP